MNKNTKYKNGSYVIGWDFNELKPLEPYKKKKETIKSNLFLVRKDFIEKYDLKLNQYLTLILLKSNITVEPFVWNNHSELTEIRNNEIASVLYVNKSNITLYLDFLRKEKFIFKGVDKYEKYWFINTKYYEELKNNSNSIIINLAFYSVCNTVESVLVLSNIWFDYFLKNKILSKKEMFLKLPINKKTIEKHIENFKNMGIISCKGKFSNEFIKQHKKFMHYEDMMIIQ